MDMESYTVRAMHMYLYFMLSNMGIFFFTINLGILGLFESKVFHRNFEGFHSFGKELCDCI
jgi:hypothetical protein